MQKHSRQALTLIELLVVIGIVSVLLGLLLPAVQKVRDMASRASCQSNLRQLGLALHQQHDSHSKFPSGYRHPIDSELSDDPEPFPHMTWLNTLLPFIEQESLWRDTLNAYAKDRYQQNTPPHTAPFQHIALFVCPADSKRPPPASNPDVVRQGLTSFLGVQGISVHTETGMLFRDSLTRFADVLDGTSNTLFVGERPPDRFALRGRWAGGWGGYWGNADVILGVREDFRGFQNCPPGPYEYQRGRIADDCSVFHFWSLHSGGANFLFVDGSVRFLPYSSGAILPALATRAGEEVQVVP
jgi:prepilin-type processing-associated H-X9-DG protein/prepilin-type N-terminal cleavage/methylation domain-containing protein